jgi:hypothetical protein
MKILVAISLGLTASLCAQQSPQKHPFTFEGMMKLKLLDGPQPSPDWQFKLMEHDGASPSI